MKRFVIPLAVCAALATVLAVAIKHSPEKGIIASALIGKSAPAFSLPDLRDPSHRITSDSLKGRWYVFNVWATWCYACRDEHPMLLAVQKQAIAPLIGLDWEDEPQDARAYLTQFGNPFAVVASDHDGRAAIDYGVTGAPETFLVNPDGVIVYKLIGALTPEIWKKEFLARIQGNAGKS